MLYSRTFVAAPTVPVLLCIMNTMIAKGLQSSGATGLLRQPCQFRQLGIATGSCSSFRCRTSTQLLKHVAIVRAASQANGDLQPPSSNGTDLDAATPASTGPRVAVEGDLVTVHFVCKDEQGNVLESSRETGEPATFEIGAGEIVGNQLFQAFDAAVRGLAVGSRTVLNAGGGEWNRDLLFDVPRDHQEIQRLSERYKNVGGLAPGLVVELANGAPAVVLEVKEDVVRLDANHMLAGKTLTFEMEIMSIERGEQ